LPTAQVETLELDEENIQLESTGAEISSALAQ